MGEGFDRHCQFNTPCFGYLLAGIGVISCQRWELSFSFILFFFLASLACIVFNSTIAELKCEIWMEINLNSTSEQGVWGHRLRKTLAQSLKNLGWDRENVDSILRPWRCQEQGQGPIHRAESRGLWEENSANMLDQKFVDTFFPPKNNFG